jgi:hypothetical protein
MAFLNDDAVNQLFNYLESNADRLLIHDTEPTNYSEATTAPLASIDVTGGDYARSSTTDGRKTEVAEKGVIADASGTDNWVAQVDDDSSTLLAVNPIPSPASYTEGLAYNVSSVFTEVEDPA